MLVVGLVSQGGGDLLDFNGVQVEHRASVGLLPITASPKRERGCPTRDGVTVPLRGGVGHVA
jgi:hypothetical protein